MIDIATLADLPECAEVGARFFAESHLPGKMDARFFCATWRHLIETGAGIIFIADGAAPPKRITGGLGGLVYADPNDGATVASELFWFIVPEARGAGLKLLRRFEHWAVKRGAKRMIMMHVLGTGRDLGPFYSRIGYRAIETHYMKEVHHG